MTCSASKCVSMAHWVSTSKCGAANPLTKGCLATACSSMEPLMILREAPGHPLAMDRRTHFVQPNELFAGGLQAADQHLRQAFHDVVAKLVIPFTRDEQMRAIETDGMCRVDGPRLEMPDVWRKQPGPAQHIRWSK